MLEDLKLKRSSLKGRITRIKNYIAEPDNQSDIGEIKARLENLNHLFQQYDEVQVQIERLDPASTKDHEADREEVENRYFKVRALGLSLLDTPSFHSTSSRLEDAEHTVPHEKFRLPQLEIPKFDGEIRSWPNFKQLFMAVIDANTSLTATQKLFYLKSALRGEAASLISALAVGEGSYSKALSILKNKYENKMVIVNYYLNNVLNFQTINRSNLKIFLNNLQQSLDSLTVLDLPVQHWDLMLIYLICQKLDNSLRAAWEFNREHIDLPSLKDLVDFLSHRATAFDILSDKPPIKPQQTQQNLRTTYVSSSNAGTNCLCNASHDLYNCPVFLEMPSIKRNEYVKGKRLCFGCLKPYKFGHKCNQSCSICGKKHHTTIHVDQPSALYASTSSADGPDAGATVKESQVSTVSSAIASGDVAVQSRVLLSTALIKSHSGQMSGGHYVAYARNPSGTWLCYNDSSCRELAAAPAPPIDPASAYLLFYERQGLDYERYLPDIKGKEPVVKDSDALDPEESDLRKLCVIA